jgi:quercetin dioxygenase-like cupin family protein
MTDATTLPSQFVPALPADNPTRTVGLVHPDSSEAKHVSVGSAGDTYTILVSGEESGGRYCLIDMFIPDGSGPPPHRHDFDESFTILEGEIVFTVRGQHYLVATGATVTIPSNAPHSFRNASGKAARMHCFCAPPGLDEFFMGVGIPVASRTASMPRVTEQEMGEHIRLIAPLAAKCRMELLDAS